MKYVVYVWKENITPILSAHSVSRCAGAQNADITIVRLWNATFDQDMKAEEEHPNS